VSLILKPAPAEAVDLAQPEALLQCLVQLRSDVTQVGQAMFEDWQLHITRTSFLPSALNLAHYLALRQHDLRSIQMALIAWGLSSLGRSEARVLPSLDAVLTSLGAVCQVDPVGLPQRPTPPLFFAGAQQLRHNTEALFGRSMSDRQVRIMVTLPTEAADDYELVCSLLRRGTNCVRINCAHDTPDHWKAMIRHVRRAAADIGQPCKVLMDLAGPKPRTGPVYSAGASTRAVRGSLICLTKFDQPPDTWGSCDLQTSCTIPEILDDVAVGNSVWIDDGKIGTRVVGLDTLPSGTVNSLLLQVTHVEPKGVKLKPEKGLNFPNANLHLSPLTDYDLKTLDFVAYHADIIGYSFVQRAADIERLQQELVQRLGNTAWKRAIAAKIETPTAIQNLPELIVHTAGKQPFAVMIARGDLAIEIGYQRLAEMQEEILWLCEAAHVPVIWATQVLESLVKTGVPTRGEITDAAMSERAECVMLNKGLFITDAVTILDDVLTRMQSHQLKKTAQMRALRSWL